MASPYTLLDDYGVPVDDMEAQKAKLRGALLFATQAPVAVAAQLAPAGQDEEGKVGWRLPGVITGAYGGLGTLGPRFANYLGGKFGYNTNLQPLPGAQAASESFADSVRLAENIPHVAPQNEDERAVSDLGFGAASMSLPLPGGMVSNLPRVVRGITHALVPTASKGMEGAKIGVALTGGMNSLEEANRDKILRDAGLDPAQVKHYRETGEMPPDLTQPDTEQTVAHPGTGASVNVPFPTGSATTTTAAVQTPAQQVSPDDDKYETLAAFGRPDIKITTPDFHSEGDTGWKWWEGALVGGGATVLAAPLLMRYGGKVFDPTIKLALRQGDQINTAARNAQFNANQAKVDTGQTLGRVTGTEQGAVRGEAPLPGKAGTVMTNLAQNLYDKNRVLTTFSDATAPPNSGVAKQMEARIGTVNNSTPMMNAIAEQMATGVNKANGGKVMPRWKATLQEIQLRLDDAQRAKLDTTLWAGDELDTRDYKFQQAAKAGKSIGPEADAGFRHNFRDVHSDQLRAEYAAGMNDPAIASVVKQVYALQAAHADHAFDMGRLTQKAAQRMTADRPRQIPSTDVEGNVLSPLAFRDVNSLGWQTPPTSAIDAITQYYSKLHADLRTNALHDDLLRQADAYYKANPQAARAVYEILDANGKPVESAPGRTHTTYRDGVAHTWNIDNSNLHRAFKGNTAKTNMLLNTADSLRRTYQHGTTGMMASVVAQRPFPLINLNRSIAQIATDRMPGTHFGLVDEAMQRGTQYAFGKKVGYRGPDPSQWIGSYHEAIKGSVAVTARHMADALRSPHDMVAAGLRKLKGDAWVDAWANKLEHRYETSNAGMRRAEAASGMASGGYYDRPMYNIRGERGNAAYSPMADVVPGVFHPDGIHLPYTKVKIPGTRGAAASYINMRSWLRDIHQEISDGGNAYYWKGLKRDPSMTPEQRTFQTRQVIGDPSLTGAGKLAQGVEHFVPWINPSVQDAVRMMRNLRDNPVATVLGTVHTVGMGVLASLFSAMLGGKRHINMLSRVMSNHDRAANITIFHDPDNEHNYTQFSLPQRWRMLTPLIYEALADALGFFQLHEGEDAYNRVMHTLSDFFSEHISHNSATGAREGLGDFVGVLQSPVASLGAALVGKQLNEPISQGMKNYAEGKPLMTDMVMDRDKATRLPGQAAGSSFVGSDDANWVQNVVKSVLGISAAGYLHATNFAKRLDLTHDIADAFGGLLTDAGQSWRDNAPFGNMIWGNNVKTTSRSPIADHNQVAWDHMLAMPNAADMQLEGLTRRGGVPVSVGGGPKVSHDPSVVLMVTTVNNYTNRIRQTVEPQLGDVRAQLKDVDNSPYFSAQDKRKLHNDLEVKKNELESQKNLMIEMMNAELSHIAGGKHVHINTFDPARGMDQFHD